MNMTENSARAKAAFWVGTVFVLGVALGGMLGYMFARRTVAAAHGYMNADARRAHHVEQMSRELDLNETQKQQLATILMQVYSQMRPIRKDEMDALRKKGRDEIRAILTPEQKAKFEAIIKRIDEQRERRAPPNSR